MKKVPQKLLWHRQGLGLRSKRSLLPQCPQIVCQGGHASARFLPQRCCLCPIRKGSAETYVSAANLAL